MTPRRSFLTGRLTWRPSSFLPSAPPPKAAENRLSFRSIPDRSLFGPMTSISRRAMATAFEFLVNDPAEDGFRGRPAAEIALDALDKIDLVEEILSVFRSGSVVSRINACASEFDVPLAEPFRHWLEKSLALGRLSDGAFDIAAGSLWEGWGFARREGRFPTEEERAEALARSGVKHLSIDEDRQVIRLDREGVILNFGGIGKGIGLDEAAGAAEAQGLKDFLVQGGRSGAVARGGRRGDHSPALRRDVWTVSVTDPLRPDPPGHDSPGRSSAGDQRLGRAVFYLRGKTLLAYPRPGHRFSRGGAAVGHGFGAHGRRGRRAVDRDVCDGREKNGRVLSGSPGIFGASGDRGKNRLGPPIDRRQYG